MMKKIALALTAFSVSTPAIAQDAEPFSGPRFGVELGAADDEFLGGSDTTWGLNAGYDVDLGGSVIGGTVSYTDAFGDSLDFRELSAGARLGVKVAGNGLVYGSAAYSDIDVAGIGLDGVKFGVGGEVMLTDKAFINVETRYGIYDFDVKLYQSVVGLGFRF